MIARRIVYSGHVQGVGFRYSVKQIAAEFEVSGTVKNLTDGRVELFIQGDPHEVEGMMDAVKTSHLNGFIRDDAVEEEKVRTEMAGFDILPTSS